MKPAPGRYYRLHQVSQLWLGSGYRNSGEIVINDPAAHAKEYNTIHNIINQVKMHKLFYMNGGITLCPCKRRGKK